MRNPHATAPNLPELPIQSKTPLQDVLLSDEVPESENGPRVLYRFPNFWVLTASCPEYEPEPSPSPEPPVQGRLLRTLLEKSGRKLRQMLGKLQQQKAPIVEVKERPREIPLPATPLVKTSTKIALPAPSSKRGIFSVPAWLETCIVLVGLVAAFASHVINMFNYPHYEQDEGTYMMYAWAVTHGSLDPYPYGYGHPPLAWIQIAAWVKFTGGFFTFGNAINSGRVLTLLLAVGCTWLVYQIARYLGVNIIACLLGTFLFSLSPLSITFQREVLLDNFATFWFLLSFYLIVVGKSRLSYTIFAAICFGITLLSKEVIIVLFPAMIYMVWLYTTKFQRPFVLVTFTYTIIAIGSTFVLMALLKGELFPYSWRLPWDHHPHLSLIDTYLTQVNRGQSGGSIIETWTVWIKGDPLLIFLGIVAPLFNLIVGWRSRKHLVLSILAISFWALLLRGGVVFAFYIIPLIPLIALNAVLALNTLVHWIGRLVRFQVLGVLLIFGAIIALIPYDIQHSLSPYNLFTQRPTLVDTEALTWIRTHVSQRAVVIINPTIYTDLHEPEGEGVGDEATYPYAQVYWFAALDPEVHDTLLRDNWDRIDYIIADSEMLNDIKTYGGGMDLIKTALEHSVLREDFKGDNYEYVQIYQVIHRKPPPNE